MDAQRVRCTGVGALIGPVSKEPNALIHDKLCLS